MRPSNLMKSIESSREPMENKEKTPTYIYYVESTEDNTVLYAINVRISPTVITWFDGTKERIMTIGEVIENNDNALIFKRDENEGGAIYKFSPLTLEIYDQKVKNRLVKPTSFETEEELIEALQSTLDNAW